MLIKRNIIFLAIFFILISQVFANTIEDKEILREIKMQCSLSYPKSKLIEYVADDAIRCEKDGFKFTNIEDLQNCFKDFLRPGIKFVDLGSGDGRVVFMASLYNADVFGVEYDIPLYKISLRAKKKLKNIINVDRVTFIRGDFLRHNFSQYDVFYFYGSSERQLPGLIKKFYNESKIGSIFILYEPSREYLEAFENNNFILLKQYVRDKVSVYKKP